MKTEQFLLRPSDDLIERLRKAARMYKRASGQQVALEVIDQYLDFWERAEDKKLQEINRQRESLDTRLLKQANSREGSGESGSKRRGKASNKKR